MCTLDTLQERIAQFPIPRDLRGKRVLDIGTWDGFFAFEMEKRGADVMAIDNWDNPRFHEMRAMMGSRIEYRQFDMYELTPDRIGYFDIVLFMGVLYHLKHPLLALERVCALTTDMAAVDSFILREEYRPGAKVDERPIMEFYESTEFGGQADNWVGPSLPCLLAMCRAAGFARVEKLKVLPHSACVACYRSWGAVDAQAVEGPELLNAFHTRNFGVNFQSCYDEYVGGTIASSDLALTLDDVKPEVSGYGVRPVELQRVSAEHLQVGFKLPPGLAPGLHEVRVRLRGSRPGSSRTIAVDLPVEAGVPRVTRVTDGVTWNPNELDFGRGDVLSVWLTGLPANVDRNTLRATLGGCAMRVEHIDPPGRSDRQVNLKAPADVAVGEAELRMSFGGIEPVAVGPSIRVHRI